MKRYEGTGKPYDMWGAEGDLYVEKPHGVWWFKVKGVWIIPPNDEEFFTTKDEEITRLKKENETLKECASLIVDGKRNSINDFCYRCEDKIKLKFYKGERSYNCINCFRVSIKELEGEK